MTVHIVVLPLPVSVNEAYIYFTDSKGVSRRKRTPKYNEWGRIVIGDEHWHEWMGRNKRSFDLPCPGLLPPNTFHMYVDRPQLRWTLHMQANVNHTGDISNRIKTTEDILAWWFGLYDAWNDDVRITRMQNSSIVRVKHVRAVLTVED